ncbi:MAG: phage holin family protein [Candidatus Enterosoma sp.]|nr:phage holin family protein [Bacilli bacterium]MDD7181377.1 phage holin family protein [Bacilli bacterium]MDY3047668.1 phage holin family protein [Candidatus Enterosoma sp.]
MNHATIPIIVVSCYLLAEIYKLAFRKLKSAYRFIPALTAIAGGLMGILIFRTAPEVMNAHDVYEAMTTGLASGAGATGANQVIKQIFGNKEVSDNDQ